MLDEELMGEIAPTLPEGVPHVFISSVTGLGIAELKDMLWTELNKESNRIEANDMAHRSKDVSRLQQELEDEGEDEDFEYEYIDDDDADDIEEDWDEEYDGEEDRD
jgi:GTP-binding protein